MKKSAVNPELKNIVEAALLVAREPVTLERLQQLFPEAEGRPTRDELRAAIEALDQDYESRGIEIRQIDKGFRIQTRDRFSTFLQRLVEERPPRYSRALLETLAIIAYRQPVTRAEVEQIRGVNVDGTMQTLLERGLVEQAGRAEVVGRPSLYATTPLFLEYFGLAGLDGLPAADELRRIVVQRPEALATAEAGLATVPPEQLSLEQVEAQKANEATPAAPAAP